MWLANAGCHQEEATYRCTTALNRLCGPPARVSAINFYGTPPYLPNSPMITPTSEQAHTSVEMVFRDSIFPPSQNENNTRLSNVRALDERPICDSSCYAPKASLLSLFRDSFLALPLRDGLRQLFSGDDITPPFNLPVQAVPTSAWGRGAPQRHRWTVLPKGARTLCH